MTVFEIGRTGYVSLHI